MRVLILSENIRFEQIHGDNKFLPPGDVHLDVDDLNVTDTFTSTVFDYDVSIVHIRKPQHHTIGYYQNIPKLIHDSFFALHNGRTIICLPESGSFEPKSSGQRGPHIYDWVRHLGLTLHENFGNDLRPSGAGRAEVIQNYLANAPKYYQFVDKPQIISSRRLAVVGETDIVVGCEFEVETGMLVILPPPLLDRDHYQLSMSDLIQVARRYYEGAQRRIPVADVPSWLDHYLVDRAKEIRQQMADLTEEKDKFDLISYALYGTGEELENSVGAMLEGIDLSVTKQPSGANIDLLAINKTTSLGFAIEVTGTKGTIQKGSNKVAQAWQYISDRAGTDEEENRLIVIANTELHLDPRERMRDSFTPDVIKLLGEHGVLLMTTLDLYELWKTVHEGNSNPVDILKSLHAKEGLFKK